MYFQAGHILQSCGRASQSLVPSWKLTEAKTVVEAITRSWSSDSGRLAHESNVLGDIICLGVVRQQVYQKADEFTRVKATTG